MSTNGMAHSVDLFDGASGRELATVNVGAGPEAAFFDDARHLAFVPSAGSGTLSSISAENDQIVRLQTLPTRPGSRTAARDRTSGRIYVPAAQFAAPTMAGERPNPILGTFELLIIGSASLAQRAHEPPASEGEIHGRH